MSKRIKISVVIPVFNAAKYLKTCLDSLLGQTFDDYEIICVNDGSKDSSLDILNSYSQKNEKVKVINIKHSGVAVARNTGLDAATGEYIQFVDSDDWVSDDLLATTYSKAKNDDLDLVCFNVANYDEQTKLIIENQFYPTSYWPANCENEILTWKNYKNVFNGNFSVVNKLYKLNFLRENNIRFIEKLHFEDHPFHLESFLKASKLGVINRSMYFYRKNISNSFMAKMGRDNRIFDILTVMDKNRQIVEDLNLFEFLRVCYFEYTIALFCDMFLNSASFLIKPRFYSKIKKYFKKINSNVDDMQVVVQSNFMMEYSDVLTCSWFVFLLKYRLIEFGGRLLANIQKFK